MFTVILIAPRALFSPENPFLSLLVVLLVLLSLLLRLLVELLALLTLPLSWLTVLLPLDSLCLTLPRVVRVPPSRTRYVRAWWLPLLKDLVVPARVRPSTLIPPCRVLIRLASIPRSVVRVLVELLPPENRDLINPTLEFRIPKDRPTLARVPPNLPLFLRLTPRLKPLVTLLLFPSQTLLGITLLTNTLCPGPETLPHRPRYL